MRILAESAGFALVEDGDRLHFVSRNTGAAIVATFVLSLLTLVPIAGGAALLALSGSSGRSAAVAGAILLGLGALSAFALWRVVRWLRARSAQGPESLARIASIDLSRRVLVGPAGEVLAPLAEVRFATAAQLGSSSRALAARWRAGRIVVARGNPFAGSVAPILDALRARGLG